jgi:glycine dehydrogenase
MAKRVSKLKNANRFFVAADVHPQTLDVVRTRAETFGFDVIVDDAESAGSPGCVWRAVAAGWHHR